jgi:hypothetical protein
LWKRQNGRGAGVGVVQDVARQCGHAWTRATDFSEVDEHEREGPPEAARAFDGVKPKLSVCELAICRLLLLMPDVGSFD